jgi:hypothetical protein
MDVHLYAIALVVFGVLYLAIGIFLAFSLLITLFILLLFLVIRHGKLPDNYPFNGREVAQTVIFIGVTWAIFVFLGPKNPLPFIGTGLTYVTDVPTNVLIAIALLVTIAFLVVFSFAQFGDSKGQSGPSPDEKNKSGA